MYDSRFIHAKAPGGKLYRDERTGNRVEYCLHSFVVSPRFGVESDFHAGFIPLDRKTFEGFEGTCQLCGDALIIHEENVLKDFSAVDKVLEKALKNMKENR